MPTRHASCFLELPLIDFPYGPQRGETALHMAARSGQAEVVRYLVQDGAQVEAKAKVRARQHGDLTQKLKLKPRFQQTFR